MAILTPAIIRQSLDDLLQTVENIGKVHQQRRIIRNEQELKQLAADADERINAWFISPSSNRTAVSERTPGHAAIGKGGGQTLTTFRFQIEGYYRIDDDEGSERDFTDLAWAVCDEINAYGLVPLDAGAETQARMTGLVEQEPAQLEQFGYIVLAQAPLLHYCRIETGWTGRTRPAGS